MRVRHLNTLAMAAVSAFALSACGGSDEAADAPAEDAPAAQQQEAPAPAAEEFANLPEGVTQEQAQQGKQVFTGSGSCYTCHGADATGTQLGPDLTDAEWLNVSGPDVAEIEEVIRTGVPEPKEHPGPMPAMGGANLSDEQVQALAAYVAAIGQG